MTTPPKKRNRSNIQTKPADNHKINSTNIKTKAEEKNTIDSVIIKTKRSEYDKLNSASIKTKKAEYRNLNSDQNAPNQNAPGALKICRRRRTRRRLLNVYLQIGVDFLEKEM